MTTRSATPDTDTGFVEVSGGRLYYEATGGGHPLTLLHAGVAHLRMWDGQVAAFAERYRVIRYDQRGFGRTTTEDVPFSNRQDLADLLGHLGVERTHLLGLSRGGRIAVDFTLERPEMVSALIAVAPGLGGFEAPPEAQAEVDWSEVERLLEAKEWEALVEREVEIWGDGPGGPRGRLDPDVRRRLLEMGLENYRREQPEGQPQVLDPPANGRLAEIRVPTLVVWGDRDTADTKAACERIVAGIPGARRVVVPGVAHMVNMERPEEFARLVLDFLDEAERR